VCLSHWYSPDLLLREVIYYSGSYLTASIRGTTTSTEKTVAQADIDAYVELGLAIWTRFLC